MRSLVRFLAVPIACVAVNATAHAAAPMAQENAVAQDDAIAQENPVAEQAPKINVLGESTLTVPTAFKAGTKKSRIVEAEYVASAGEGNDKQTARVYGMASGGGVGPNIDRWKAQFSDSPKDAFKKETIEVGTWKIHLVDVAGKFADSMGGGPFAPGKKVIREDHAMTGAILENAKGRLYFLKLIGPAEVVKANREAFVKMVKSIGE